MSFNLKLEDLGQKTKRRFFSNVIDDYKEISVDSIENYKISRKKLPELRPKFISVANGRDFYYLIEDIKIENVSLENNINKVQQPTKIEKSQTKETFNISKSKDIFNQSQIERLTNIMKEAVESEDFERAAELRDKINALLQQKQGISH